MNHHRRPGPACRHPRSPRRPSMAVRWPQIDWQNHYPTLAAYLERIDRRPSFAATRPEAQVITDRVV